MQELSYEERQLVQLYRAAEEFCDPSDFRLIEEQCDPYLYAVVAGLSERMDHLKEGLE